MKWLLAPLLLVSCVAHTEPASVRLEFGTGLCTGTVVAPHTILTAAHCVEGLPLTSVDDVETHAVRIIRDGADHALITVDRKLGRAYLRMAQPKVGVAVHWTGNPAGLRRVYRKGYVAAVYADGALIDAQGWYGDSGSGVFDDDGNLIGVVSAGKRVEREGGLAMQLVILFPLKFTRNDWKAVR